MKEDMKKKEKNEGGKKDNHPETHSNPRQNEVRDIIS